MSLPTIRRSKPPTKKQRALSAAGTGGSAAVKFLKARIRTPDEPAETPGVNAVPPAPAGVA
jgi:hypothetical protein